jgi:RNA polymerase sigma factor (sigma-70 family)
MLRVQEGDLDQLGLLFERYNRVLFAFFYGQNRNAMQSEDLVQNVFMRVLQYRHRFRGDGEFKAWLFHIARNVHYDHFRKKQRRRTEQIDAWQDKVIDPNANRPQEMIRQEELTRLRLTLQRLPEKHRQVLEMSKLQGMAYSDIATVLNCTEGAVKVKVFRALQALKKAYTK